MAIGWNLDKVVGRNGNMIRYFYETESNKYGLNMKDAPVENIRGGVLRRVDYGLNANVATAQAPAQVEFASADRCLPGSTCTPDYTGLLSTISAYLELPISQQEQIYGRTMRVLPETVEIVADITVHLARRRRER